MTCLTLSDGDPVSDGGLCLTVSDVNLGVGGGGGGGGGGAGGRGGA